MCIYGVIPEELLSFASVKASGLGFVVFSSSSISCTFTLGSRCVCSEANVALLLQPTIMYIHSRFM